MGIHLVIKNGLIFIPGKNSTQWVSLEKPIKYTTMTFK